MTLWLLANPPVGKLPPATDKVVVAIPFASAQVGLSAGSNERPFGIISFTVILSTDDTDRFVTTSSNVIWSPKSTSLLCPAANRFSNIKSNNEGNIPASISKSSSSLVGSKQLVVPSAGFTSEAESLCAQFVEFGENTYRSNTSPSPLGISKTTKYVVVGFKQTSEPNSGLPSPKK